MSSFIRLIQYEEGEERELWIRTSAIKHVKEVKNPNVSWANSSIFGDDMTRGLLVSSDALEVTGLIADAERDD